MESEPVSEQLERALAEIAELKEQLAHTPSESALKTWLAAAGTVSVTLLAFLIPSIQDQWDRHVQHQGVEEYREVARQLMAERKYYDAEHALERAVELNGTPRPDLERERLVAKTAQVNADRAWGGKIEDDSLEESDFTLLEALQARAGERTERAWTLNNHAVFLAHRKQLARALPLLQQALTEAPRDARIRVTLGNVHWDLGDLDAALHAFSEALALQPNEVTAHYNLALLLEERGDLPAARVELQRVLALQPEDSARDDLLRLSQDTHSRT